MQDIEKRPINFPNFRALRQPLRSSHDGSFANGEEMGNNCLARWVVWHMLIYPFDWPKTSDAIISMLAPITANQDDFRPHFISFGPSSEWLLGEFKSQELCQKSDMMEMSAFRASNTLDYPCNNADDIAIVGMGVHYPNGHGQEELWNTLCNGAVAVSEVSTMSTAGVSYSTLSTRYLRLVSMLLSIIVTMATIKVEQCRLTMAPSLMMCGNLITRSST